MRGSEHKLEVDRERMRLKRIMDPEYHKDINVRWRKKHPEQYRTFHSKQKRRRQHEKDEWFTGEEAWMNNYTRKELAVKYGMLTTITQMTAVSGYSRQWFVKEILPNFLVSKEWRRKRKSGKYHYYRCSLGELCAELDIPIEVGQERLERYYKKFEKISKRGLTPDEDE